VSLSFVVHGGKDRLEVDLRRINQCIRHPSLQYQILAGFLSSLVPGEHLVSWDVIDVFYHIRIHPSHRKFFCVIVAGFVYEPHVLPFFMRLSP